MHSPTHSLALNRGGLRGPVVFWCSAPSHAARRSIGTVHDHPLVVGDGFWGSHQKFPWRPAPLVLSSADRRSTLLSPIERWASLKADASTNSPNGSNLLPPGWGDIQLPPPTPTASAFCPPSTPVGFCPPGFLFCITLARTWAIPGMGWARFAFESATCGRAPGQQRRQ